MIYLFDLDETLCYREDVTNPDYTLTFPYKERIKKVNELYDEGHTIIIETARGSNTGIDWYNITYNQLLSWNVKFHQLRTGVKFAADYFVDDKAINIKNFFKE